MRCCTRFVRVRSFNAAVALAAAALSCGGSRAGPGPRVQGTTTLIRYGIESHGFTVGERCNASGLETCFNATDDNCNGLVDEGCGLATGPLQIVVAWDLADADVDLEVTDPNGEQAEVAKSTQLGLTKDRDCPGDGDECGGQNFEVVTLQSFGEPLPKGRYRVTLHLERAPSESAKVHVRIGGHWGQDALHGQVELSRETPRISVELLRSSPGAGKAAD